MACPFLEALSDAGIVAGIKVDTGAKELAGFPGEKITEGLDGLRDRLREYFNMGARFAKWRAVIAIDDRRPSRGCIEANAHALARYAALCQEAGLVPVVEPEVLMDGDHTLERCREVTAECLRAVFDQLHGQRVLLEGMILKPNMVLAGLTCPQQESATEVAARHGEVPPRSRASSRSGIAFLSGGQSGEPASARSERHAREVRVDAIATAVGADIFLRTRHSAARAGHLERRGVHRGAAQQRCCIARNVIAPPVEANTGLPWNCLERPLRLFLIRHGETAWSITGQHTGFTDIVLTAHGEDEARELASRLANDSFTRILTSPLRRARQTCELAGFGAKRISNLI